MKIILLCRSLNYGGAERQLALLARGLTARGHGVSVAVFYRGGPFDAELSAEGIAIHDLAKSGRWDVVGFVLRFLGLVRRERPDAIYGFLPVPNIFAALAKLATRKTRIVFGVRSSRMDLARYDRLSRWTYRIEAMLSGCADLIVVNSRDGMADAIRRGFPKSRTVLLRNGIDTKKFAPDAAGRAALRAEWGVADGEILVGQVGRIDPMKGYETFIDGAAALVQRGAVHRFVCIGDGDPVYRAQLQVLAASRGLGDKMLWTGLRDDLARCYSAIDVLCLASRFGEGFPNVVAEAMACGTVCVVTDLGDARDIVGEWGTVVPPENPSALAEAVEGLEKRLGTGRAELAAAARRSIETRFGTDNLAAETETLLTALLRSRAGAAAS